MTATKPVLETHSLTIGYTAGRRLPEPLHNAIDVQLYSGRLTGLLGLNGAGKSTLLRTLCGFQPALAGNVVLCGKPLGSYSAREMSRTIGTVLTERTHAGGITVGELVALGRHPYTGFFGRLTSDDHAIVASAMADAGIAHMANRYVSELSDGERQKAMIAKALAQQCPIIVLDEPAAFLDAISRIEIMTLLRTLAVEQGKAVLLSTHDVELALQLCDCLWLLQRERPVAAGAPEDLLLDGRFEYFFQRPTVAFDRSTGRLHASRPFLPVALETPDQTARYWLDNALRRNGCRAVEPSPGLIAVRMAATNRFELTMPDGTRYESTTVGRLTELLQRVVASSRIHQL